MVPPPSPMPTSHPSEMENYVVTEKELVRKPMGNLEELLTLDIDAIKHKQYWRAMHEVGPYRGRVKPGWDPGGTLEASACNARW
jgi:hypothetical protein